MDNYYKGQDLDQFFQDSFWSSNPSTDFTTPLLEPDQSLVPSSEDYVADPESVVNDAGQLREIREYLDPTNEIKQEAAAITYEPPLYRGGETLNPRRLQTIPDLLSEVETLGLMISKQSKLIDTALQQVALLKDVYDKLKPWSMEIQVAVSELALYKETRSTG